MTSSAPPTDKSEATTSAPPAPIKLTSMDVTSEVTLRYAHTAVVTHVRNPAARAQEHTFRVLLPETAFISGFVMSVDSFVSIKKNCNRISTWGEILHH